MAYHTNPSTLDQAKYAQFQQSEDELIPGLPYDLAMECLLRVPITSHPTLRLVSHQWSSTISHPSFFSLRRISNFAHNHVFLIQPQSPPRNHQDDKSITQQQFDVDVDEVKGSSDTSNCILSYSLNLYNTVSNEWSCLSGLTIPTFSQCVVLPEIGKVVVLGGCDPMTLEPVSRVLVIDLALGIWREGSPMTKARSFFAVAAAAPATVYVSGGHDGQKNALRSAEAYDVVADEWRELPSMEEERDECYGLLMNDGKFLVVSGYGTESQGRFRPDGEVFDPIKWEWETVTGVWPHPGKAPKSTAVVTVEGERKWWDVVGDEIREFEWAEKVWKRVDIGSGSQRVNGLWGSSTTVNLIDVGNGKILLMSNGENSNGERMFILERVINEDKIKMKNDKNNNKMKCDVNNNWKWQHVEAPSKFLGFPFSATHILM